CHLCIITGRCDSYYLAERSKTMPLPQSRRMAFSEVPLLDIGALVRNPDGADDVVRAMDKACTDVGFMNVVNHGVPREVVRAAYESTLQFFQQPLEAKLEVSMAKSDQFRGFIPNKAGGKKSAVNHREGFIMRA